MKQQIDAEWDGMSVLDVLRLLGLSGGMIRHIKFLDNGITVNGERVTVRHVLRQGETLAIMTDDLPDEQKVAPVALPLPILYEDAHIVIPDKPPFMPTHPSHDHYYDTVANALAHRYAPAPYVFRPVNRLDKNTSGAVLIARHRIAAARLVRAMQEHRIHKTYLAVLCGRLPSEEGEIETYMRRTEQSIIVRQVCEEQKGADYALTRYRVLLQNDTHTLVSASPITGRTHQLRVHFSHLGCPLVGDDLYGSADERIGRHALHAHTLRFPHPESGEEMTVTAPLHPDMLRLIHTLFPGKDLPL